MQLIKLIFCFAPIVWSQKALERTKGVMPEFVNPKYADSEKTVFKKPTRLECMMQVSFLLVLSSD